MSSGAEIIIELVPEVAVALGGRDRGIVPSELGIDDPTALLRPAGDAATVSSLSLYVADLDRAADVVERLRSHHWVTAAYIKPGAQPPRG